VIVEALPPPLAVIAVGVALMLDCDAETGPAFTVRAGEVASVSPVAVTRNVYPVPVLSRLTPGKLTVPDEAARVSVPDSAPPDGLAPSPSDTAPVNDTAVFPFTSSALTCTVGANDAPATADVGTAVNASLVAGPGPGGPAPSPAQAANSNVAASVDLRERVKLPASTRPP
jgi:hypothetical protein